MFASKVVLGVVVCAWSLYGAADCKLPENLFAHRPNDLFSDAREGDLGDAVDEQIARSLRVIEAPRETAFLDRFAAQLLAHAPATQIHFRFKLIDAPDANAFSLPGGHIYVTRKLIALLQSSDEVAAVIGHEMGHILSHQGSQAMSREMRRVLKTDSLASRDDVFRQYALLSEAYLNPRNQRTEKDREREDQAGADRISVSLLMAAGYDPEALVTSLDRITGSGGQHGNLFTDLFGITPAEGKRIRELEKTVDRLPSGCAVTEPPIQLAELKAWQARVLKLAVVSPHSASVPGLLSVHPLAPPLVSDMQYIHFSPDGKFAIAQDDATIHVLSIEPFGLLFDIPAADAERALFSPDSGSISFVTDSLRFEKWDIASKKQIAVQELQFPKGCMRHRLSPSGHLFACVQPNQKLLLSRVQDGEVVFEADVAPRTGNDSGWMDDLYSFLPPEMEFSPNESWLLLTHPVEFGSGMLLLDLHSYKPAKIPVTALRVLASSFVFLRDDQVLMQGFSERKEGAVLQLPRFEVLESLVVPSGWMKPLSDPRFVLIETEGKYAAVVTNLAEKAIVMGSALPALDLRENLRLTGTGGGQLKLAKDKAQLGTVTLENPKLGGGDMRMASSAGLEWMAVSNASRAVVWNLSNGDGYVAAGFEHADFPEPQLLNLVTAPYLGQKQKVMSVDLGKRSLLKNEPSEADPAQAETHFWNGAVRFVLEQGNKGATLTAYEGMGKSLWSETFVTPPFPARTLSPELLAITWPAESHQGAKLIKADGELKKEKAQAVWGALVLQVRNARTGEILRQRLVSTQQRTWLRTTAHVLQNSELVVAGKWIVLQEPGNRIVIEKWDDGAVVARSFGRVLAFDENGARLLVQNRGGELRMIDLHTGAEGQTMQFPERVVAAAFRKDGQQFGVVTADQKVYMVGVR